MKIYLKMPPNGIDRTIKDGKITLKRSRGLMDIVLFGAILFSLWLFTQSTFLIITNFRLEALIPYVLKALIFVCFISVALILLLVNQMMELNYHGVIGQKISFFSKGTLMEWENIAKIRQYERFTGETKSYYVILEGHDGTTISITTASPKQQEYVVYAFKHVHETLQKNPNLFPKDDTRHLI